MSITNMYKMFQLTYRKEFCRKLCNKNKVIAKLNYFRQLCTCNCPKFSVKP